MWIRDRKKQQDLQARIVSLFKALWIPRPELISRSLSVCEGPRWTSSIFLSSSPLATEPLIWSSPIGWSGHQRAPRTHLSSASLALGAQLSFPHAQLWCGHGDHPQACRLSEQAPPLLMVTFSSPAKELTSVRIF